MEMSRNTAAGVHRTNSYYRCTWIRRQWRRGGGRKQLPGEVLSEASLCAFRTFLRSLQVVDMWDAKPASPTALAVCLC